MTIRTQLPEFMRQRLMAAARKWLKDTCTIDENQSITGEFGEPRENRVRLATDTPCRVIQAAASRSTGAVNEAGAQENILEEYRLEVLTTIDLRSDLIVTVNGEEYSIVRIEKALTDELFRQAVMVKRT